MQNIVVNGRQFDFVVSKTDLFMEPDDGQEVLAGAALDK